MRHMLYALLVVFMVSAPAAAQNEGLDIVSEPICFQLINEAPYSVYGKFSTDEFTRPDGIKTRHRSNFRLQQAGSINEESGFPSDRAEFCSYGPFMPDRQLELMLRSLVPLYACKTRVDKGSIVIKGYRKDEGGTKTWAECYAADGTKNTLEPAD